MSILWPKIIKLSDVVDALDDLAARVGALEQYVRSNDARITRNEQYIAGLVAAGTERNADLARQVAQLQAATERTRWAMKTGRKP